MATESTATAASSTPLDQPAEGFLFASNDAHQWFRREPLVPGRGSVLLALPNVGLFDEITEVLKAEGPGRCDKICLVEARTLSSAQVVQVVRQLDELSWLANSARVDTRSFDGDPGEVTIALCKHLHDTLATLRRVLPAEAFKPGNPLEQRRRALRSASTCWRLLCDLSSSVGATTVLPPHPLAVTLEETMVRIKAAASELAGCEGVNEFRSGFTSVYDVLTETDPRGWEVAYDSTIDASPLAERFLVRCAAEFGEPATPMDEAEASFFRSARRAIGRIRGKRKAEALAKVEPKPMVPNAVAVMEQASSAESGGRQPGRDAAIRVDSRRRAVWFKGKEATFDVKASDLFRMLTMIVQDRDRTVDLAAFNAKPSPWANTDVDNETIARAVKRLRAYLRRYKAQELEELADLITTATVDGNIQVALEDPCDDPEQVARRAKRSRRRKGREAARSSTGAPGKRAK